MSLEGQEQEPLLEQDFIQQQDFIPSSKQQSTLMTCLNLLSLIGKVYFNPVGLGLITVPYAFATLGWLSSISLIILLTILSIYSALKIHQSLEITDSNGLDGLANTAFGTGSGVLVDLLITLQLILLSSSSLILFADGFVLLFPNLEIYKRFVVVLGFLVITPFGITELYSIRVMSGISILSFLILLITIVYDGSTTGQRPGSFTEPMETELLPRGKSFLRQDYHLHFQLDYCLLVLMLMHYSRL
jgi:amino acid permease